MTGSKVSEHALQYFQKRDLLMRFYIPVQHHAIKKNNRPIWTKGDRPILGKSDALRKAESHLVTQFTLKYRQAQNYEPIKEDVWMMALFHYEFSKFYTKKGVRSKNVGDLSNHYQIVEDCLQTARVIEDDKQIQAHDWSRILPGKETALEVYILRFDEKTKTDVKWEDLGTDAPPH